MEVQEETRSLAVSAGPDATADESRQLGTLPISFVPTPTKEYRTYRKRMKATVQPGTPVVPAPVPTPVPLPS